MIMPLWQSTVLFSSLLLVIAVIWSFVKIENTLSKWGTIIYNFNYIL